MNVTGKKSIAAMVSARATGTALVVLIAGTTLAVAGPGDRMSPEVRAEHMFERFDLDGDDVITPAEIANARAARFGEIDTDGDGQLSADEMLVASEQMRAEHEAMRRDARARAGIDRLDTDGNGALSLTEIEAARAEMKFDPMARFGADDGAGITREEVETAMAEHPMRRGGGAHRGERGDHDDDMRRGGGAHGRDHARGGDHRNGAALPLFRLGL